MPPPPYHWVWGMKMVGTYIFSGAAQCAPHMLLSGALKWWAHVYLLWGHSAPLSVPPLSCCLGHKNSGHICHIRVCPLSSLSEGVMKLVEPCTFLVGGHSHSPDIENRTAIPDLAQVFLNKHIVSISVLAGTPSKKAKQ